MKMKELVPHLVFTFGVVFFIWALCLTTAVALGIAFDTTAAGLAATGTFLAGVICVLCAHGMYLENEKKE